MRLAPVDRDRDARLAARRAALPPIRCTQCGERSGGIGSSRYGSCHQWGPVADHWFQPDRAPDPCETAPIDHTGY